jgi:hypothetical protein
VHDEAPFGEFTGMYRHAENFTGVGAFGGWLRKCLQRTYHGGASLTAGCE